MESERREKAYTFVTYTAVTFSLIAILAVFVTLPMVNNYVNNINARVAQEMEFCQVNSILIINLSISILSLIIGN